MACSTPSTNLRHILPRPDRLPLNSQPLNPPSFPFIAPKRKAVSAACESCRQRKAKCDGIRPRCSGCISLDRECQFDTEPEETRKSALKRKYGEIEQEKQVLQESNSSLEQLFTALRTRNESDASLIFQLIRRGVEIETIIRHINVGDLLLQLQLAPEVRYQLDCQCSSPMPEYLLTHNNNPYLKPMIYEFALPSTNRPQQCLTSSTGQTRSSKAA